VFGGAPAGSYTVAALLCYCGGAVKAVVLLWWSRRSLSSVAPLALSVMTEGARAPTRTCTGQHSFSQCNTVSATVEAEMELVGQEPCQRQP
jgi:hypothetical protein